MDIKSIIWVTHPAFGINPPNHLEYNREEIDSFVKKELLPFVELASKKKNTIVVFVRSPKRNNGDVKKQKILAEIESNILKRLRNKMGNKLIATYPDIHKTEDSVAKYVNSEAKRMDFKIDPKTRHISTGAFRKMCTLDYPFRFLTNRLQTRIRIKEIKKKTLPARKRPLK